MAQSKHISIGRIGESIAAGYLENRGYTIRARNYRKRCGELDLVAYKEHVLHFVEVKSASWSGPWPVDGDERYRPEDHLHKQKFTRLGRAIECYVTEFPINEDDAWTIDLVTVYIDEVQRRALVELVPNIRVE